MNTVFPKLNNTQSNEENDCCRVDRLNLNIVPRSKSPKFNEILSRYEMVNSKSSNQVLVSKNKSSRIMIVDDHITVRHGIKMLLGYVPGIKVCCSVENSQQALDSNRACPHDLAIIDITLGKESGIELADKLIHEFPKLKILMLSMHDERDYAETSLLAGVHGYLMKEKASRNLVYAIKTILNGELYTSQYINSQVLEHTIFPTQQISISNISRI